MTRWGPVPYDAGVFGQRTKGADGECSVSRCKERAVAMFETGNVSMVVWRTVCATHYNRFRARRGWPVLSAVVTPQDWRRTLRDTLESKVRPAPMQDAWAAAWNAGREAVLDACFQLRTPPT